MMGNKTSIYAVDDDELIIKIIEMEFKCDDDYSFEYFTNAKQFISSLTEDIDLVIMDVNMPDFNVVRAVEVIDDLSPLAYVIVISADRDFNTLNTLTNMGIFRFCQKDGANFLPNLRHDIKAAHKKIAYRKKILTNGG